MKTLQEFRIPAAMAREIIEHAQEEYPKECCGIILGPIGEPRELHRLRNIDPDPVMRYNVEPKDIMRLDQRASDLGWDFACIYHSHTHTPAFPSRTDVERAGYPDAVYALVSLADRGKPDLRAFRIVDGNIEEMSVVQET
jgi:proteasome lid subunit RPN8/RPN11